MANLRLQMLTPERELFDSTVDQVTAEGSLGQFGVLPLHIPYLTSLEPGSLTFHSGTSSETVLVKSGFAEVSEDRVTILADEALRVDELDAESVADRVERAKTAAEETPFGHSGYDAARRELRWAEVLLEVVRA